MMLPWKRFHVIQPIGGFGASCLRGVGAFSAEAKSDERQRAAERIKDLFIMICLL